MKTKLTKPVLTPVLTNAQRRTLRVGGLIATLALLSGCASHDTQRAEAPSSATQAAAPASPAAGTSGGRYAMSGDAYPLEPPDVTKVPDAEPRIEEPSRGGNRSSYEVWGKTYHVLPDATGYAKQGIASWYGEKFHGYATSNGEIYDMYKMSAAHRSLPLPTFARVTSLDNGRSVIVRVNDRGPFHSDREIDLSYAAAARLGFLDHGTGRVKVEAINPQQWLAQQASGEAPAQASAPAPSAGEVTSSPSDRDVEGAVYLQIAALGNSEGAQTLQQRLEDAQPHAVRIVSDTDVYRVQVGPLNHAQESTARETLRQAGFPQVFVVR